MRNYKMILVTLAATCGVAIPAFSARSEIDAASLVRAVRESENWIHHVDTLLIRIESTWTKTGTAVAPDCNSCVESDDKCPVPAPKLTQPPQFGPMPDGILEYAFDEAQVRFLDEQPQRWRRLKVWDGKQLIAYERSLGSRKAGSVLSNPESYNLNWTAQGSFEEFVAYQTGWLRAQPHSFWWDHKDVDELLCYYGRPEEFVLTGRSNYRGVDCYVLEFHPTEVRGIVDGQSYRCDSAAISSDEYGLIGEARALADQSYRWYVGIEDRHLYGLVWLIGKKPHTEHWMSDYKQVSAGCWLPMTQGYELYGRDTNGQACLQARRELKVLQVRINEKLPDELFHIELKKGVQVVDNRSGRTARYTYEPDPPELAGKPAPGFEDMAVELSVGQPPLSRGGKMLVCFWDMEQRPSRHLIKTLAEQARSFAEQNITVVILQASHVHQAVLDAWVKQNNIPFVVGQIVGDAQAAKYSWGVRALPWLILTDRKGVVSAAGFGVTELSTRIAEVIDAERRDLTGVARDL